MTLYNLAQKIPIRPTKTQINKFEQSFGARRFAYNRQVAVFNSYSEDNKILVL